MLRFFHRGSQAIFWGVLGLDILHEGNHVFTTGIFLGLMNEKNLPKMVYIIRNFLVLHFGENFIKIRTKIAKI